MSNIREDLVTVIAELFECDKTEVTGDIGPGELEGWDSLGHVSLMSEIQDKFGKHIPVEDAIEVESVDDIVELLESIN